MSGKPVDAAAVGAPQPQPQRNKSRNRLFVLAVLALIAGVVGSWAYNSGLSARQSHDAVAIRAAADPSAYVAPGDYYRVTVPVRNDSPFAVTVVGLYLPTAPKIQWDGAWTVIQSGGTAVLKVDSPFNCPAVPHPLKHPTAVPVLLRVLTVNGDSHSSLRAFVNGMLQYAADYCATSAKTTA